MKITKDTLKGLIKEAMTNAAVEHEMARRVFEEETQSGTGEFT